MRADSKEDSMIKSTFWLLASNGAKLVLQAMYFVIIARALGPEQYGAFVGATSLISILSPFATLGIGSLLVKNVSRNRNLFNIYWGNSLLVIVTIGLGLALLSLPLSYAFLPKTIPISLIFFAAIADLIFLRIIDTSAQAFQSVLWLSKTAQLNILPQITRLLAAITLILIIPDPNALSWTFIYLISTAMCAAISGGIVSKLLGKPELDRKRIIPELKEGIYFSLGLSSQTIYNDIDKTMLARLANLADTGLYAAAYRIIDVSFVPVRSLLGAAYARFFRSGEKGISGTLALAKQLLPIAALYGAFAGVAIFFCAPVVEKIFGDEYSGTVDALRWLAPIPFLKAMHYFAADALTGAGFQSVRSKIQVLVALFNVLLNLWLIPKYSWLGASWSSIASDFFLMTGLWLMVYIFNRANNKEIMLKA
jgi:O-antigen/teichoic acid export membrane protein